MSNNMFARLDLLDQASFNADHTIDIYSQHPGTFSMQPYKLTDSLYDTCLLDTNPDKMSIVGKTVITREGLLGV